MTDLYDARRTYGMVARAYVNDGEPVPAWVFENLLFIGQRVTLVTHPECVATCVYGGLNCITVRLANGDMEWWLKTGVVLTNREPTGFTKHRVVICDAEDADEYLAKGYIVRVAGFSRLVSGQGAPES